VPCSARKKKLSRDLRAAQLPEGSQAVVAKAWLKRLKAVPAAELARADELYLGRVPRLARLLAEECHCSYFIASAGLGLVRASRAVPGYDLTLSAKSEHSVRNRVRETLDDAQWWEQMQTGRFASSLDELVAGPGRIVIALTRPYTRFVTAAFSHLAHSERHRLRIVGFGIVPRLPEELRSQLITYDNARLDRLIPGTKHDASVRALVHFARAVKRTPLQEATMDQDLVDRLLKDIKPTRPVPERERVTDAVLRRKIRGYLREGASTSAALKHLRRQARIACEEHRFKRLFREISP